MKAFIFITLLMSFSVLCRAEKQVVLDLNGGITWKGIFDAGLRPKHLSGGEYMCTQYGVALAIKNSKTGLLMDLGVGDVDFKLKANHQLIQLLFYGSKKRGLEEARVKSEDFSRLVGQEMTQRAKLATFQTKHEIDYVGQKIDPPVIEEHVDLKTTTNVAKVGEFSIVYDFSDSYNDHLPLLEHLYVTLESKEAKQAKRLSGKIRPPDGYEHISLEPNQDDLAPKKESAAKNPNLLPWIIVGVFLLGILTILIRAFMRGRKS